MTINLYHKMDDYYSGNTPEVLINETIVKIGEILDKYYPEYIRFDNGAFAIIEGSTQVMILVRPFTTEEACIEFLANVVTGATISNDLMRFLLRKNAELHFGSFGILFDDTVTFSHSISTAGFNEKELLTSLDSVAIIADYYDDIIVDLAGGKRAKDFAESL